MYRYSFNFRFCLKSLWVTLFMFSLSYSLLAQQGTERHGARVIYQGIPVANAIVVLQSDTE